MWLFCSIQKFFNRYFTALNYWKIVSCIIFSKIFGYKVVLNKNNFLFLSTKWLNQKVK